MHILTPTRSPAPVLRQTRPGGHSYGVVELVTGAILVCYLYWLRGKMSEIRSRIRNSQSLSTLTAADFTVMVSDLPDCWRPDDIRSFFERFGEVRSPASHPPGSIALFSPFPIHVRVATLRPGLSVLLLANRPAPCTHFLVTPKPNARALCSFALSASFDRSTYLAATSPALSCRRLCMSRLR